MEWRVLKIAKRAAVLLAVIAITLMAVGIYDTQRGAAARALAYLRALRAQR